METVLEDPSSKNAQQVWLAGSVSILRNRRRKIARYLYYLAFVTLVPVPTLLILDAWTFGKDIADYPWMQMLLVSVLTNGVFIVCFFALRIQCPRLVHGVALGANEIRLDCPNKVAVMLPLNHLDCIKLQYDGGGSLLAVKLRYRESLWPWSSLTLSAQLLPLTKIWPSLDASVPHSVPRKISSTGNALLGLTLALSVFTFLALDLCAIFFLRMWLYRGI